MSPPGDRGEYARQRAFPQTKIAPRLSGAMIERFQKCCSRLAGRCDILVAPKRIGATPYMMASKRL